MERNLPKLEINSYLYQAGLDFVKARKRWGVKSLLKAIERVSAGAWFHHPGRFADGALENHALEVGHTLKNRGKDSFLNLPIRKRCASRTLHLATTLFDVGGHSRVLVKWVEMDKSSDHVIVLTDQGHAVPDFLREIITRSGNYFICLPQNESIENRASEVRNISKSCDRVILHTNPRDSIPVVAFAKEGGPPVAMFNHAHYFFSVGSTVSDVIINTAEYFRRISERYRFARSTALLGEIPGLWKIGSETIDKEAARRKLCLPERATVIMSMGQEHYFQPMEGYNFFHTARSILNELPGAYLMLVGVRKESPLVPGDLKANPRVLLMGYVQNPIVHYQASDIFLESFPMPSLGAVSEAVAYGEAFPVYVYGPGESILRLDRSMSPLVYRAPDEEAYVGYVANLGKRKEEIRAEARKMRAKTEECNQRFEGHLYKLNSMLDSLKHSPKEIPVAEMIESDDCRTLAELDQSGIGEKIDALFPFIQSIGHHIDAVLKGYQTSDSGIERILSHMRAWLSRRVARFGIWPSS